ncbi:C1 family peptidase [bacterium]|nr:C1 family peptidase [bacterium]
MRITLVLVAMVLSVAAWAETPSQRDIQTPATGTGLVVPANWKTLAPWRTNYGIADEEIPEYFDWRFYAFGLTPVKRQGWNDCWAQGTVGVMESLIKIKMREEVNVSVQEVISCSGSGSAANGGYFAHAYHQKKGAVTNDDFPYVARDVACKKGLTPRYQLARWGYVGASNRKPTVSEIKQAIMAHGPVGVTIYANNALQNFTNNSGVFKGCGNGGTNHIEVIVGWNDREGTNGVWFVRNSWGTSHGDQGYAKIPYNCSRVGETATWADLQINDDALASFW